MSHYLIPTTGTLSLRRALWYCDGLGFPHVAIRITPRSSSTALNIVQVGLVRCCFVRFGLVWFCSVRFGFVRFSYGGAPFVGGKKKVDRHAKNNHGGTKSTEGYRGS